MKSKIIYVLHLIIRIFRLEKIVIKICDIFKIKKWKALPQNLFYNNHDKIRVNKNNIIFDINRNDFTQWQIYADYPELHFEAFLRLKKKGNIIDVGANIGAFSLLAASYLRKSSSYNKVYCFEPYHPIFEKLVKNIELNKNLKDFLIVEDIALGSIINEKLTFKIIKKNLGANFLEPTNTQSFEKEEDFIFGDTLDNYCKKKNIKNISFLKIDVEGMELDVLKGSENIITKYRPDIFIEINEKKYNDKGQSFKSYLFNFEKEKRNFLIENINQRNFQKISSQEVLLLLKNKKNNFNLLIS